MLNRDAMVKQLRLHEGERLKPYRCTAGKLTIGVGRNLEDRGITAEESAMLLANDITAMETELMRALPWVAQLDEVRQRVLIDMAFNLGVQGLLNFKRTLAAVQAGQYQQAAAMMLESRWAQQVGQRAKRLSDMMASGKTPRELWVTP
jgi:lysozyme